MTQREKMAVGRALSHIPELADLGKGVESFRLFEGHVTEIQTVKDKPGGRRKK